MLKVQWVSTKEKLLVQRVGALAWVETTLVGWVNHLIKGPLVDGKLTLCHTDSTGRISGPFNKISFLFTVPAPGTVVYLGPYESVHYY